MWLSWNYLTMDISIPIWFSFFLILSCYVSYLYYCNMWLNEFFSKVVIVKRMIVNWNKKKSSEKRRRSIITGVVQQFTSTTYFFISFSRTIFAILSHTIINHTPITSRTKTFDFLVVERVPFVMILQINPAWSSEKLETIDNEIHQIYHYLLRINLRNQLQTS